LEWVFRLAQDPRRLARRYLWNDARILLVLARELAQRWRRANAPSALPANARCSRPGRWTGGCNLR
ncbi:MAG: glycosyltransferase, partial [Myxococcales bacterium]